MIAWKRNLYFIIAAMFLSGTGFSFAVPFVPFYFQEMGVRDAHALKIWIMLFNFAPAFTLAIFSPIWGALSDRYGRRLMLLRATFGSVVVLFLMGAAPTPAALIILRLLQGALTGSVSASQTMVSVCSPKERVGFSLGMLSAAVCSGSTSGAFFGGMFAEMFGYRLAFVASSGILLLAAGIVLFGTEEYIAKRKDPDDRPQKLRFSPGNLGSNRLILIMLAAIGVVMLFDAGWLPLLVQEIHGGISGAAFITGSLAAAGGIAGFIAGPVIGRLADRITPPVIARFSSLGAGFMTILTALAGCFPFLFFTRFCTAFCAGGLDPVFQIWLSRVTPEKDRGSVFGWALTARSIGWMLAPLISGAVARLAGVRAIFFAAAAFYFLLVPLISLIVNKLEKNRTEKPDNPVPGINS
jgi:DHA1 family multidrug resistance protein-like MFS transporter